MVEVTQVFLLCRYYLNSVIRDKLMIDTLVYNVAQSLPMYDGMHHFMWVNIGSQISQ